MRIAFFVYPSAFQAPGGGEILLLKTKEALEKRGITVKLFDQWQDKLKSFDILHVFGSVKECLGLMQTARNVGVKVVLSPIFWSTLQRAWHEYGSFYKKSQLVLRHISKVICPVVPSARRRMFVLADALVPNSEAEAEQIARLFWIDRAKMHVVPLAADERFTRADKTEFVNKYGVKDFILSVGRIEPRKNQLNLIRALKGQGLKLIFIGSPVSGNERYYQVCRDESDRNTLFIERIGHDNSLLSSAYVACNVFVLQGWFETPGLAALEAGMAGAKLAVTEVGSTREYFKDYAEYFNPASPASIRAAVDRALRKEKSDELKNYILEHFLWSHSAEANIKVYKKLMD